tara:strand:- start:1642 stop:1986 length:345 start_codon:yes stop_codon:yes gene_type:complete
MTTIEATLVKTKVETQEKTQRLFKMSSPVYYEDWDFDTDDVSEMSTDFILVSRVVARDHGDWETLIFPADEDGEVLDWMELWGVRGWEHIGTTLNNFLEARNATRLQASIDSLD